ncbi:MAG: hypothetical protein VX424_20885 [Actinomycetota bacterium]|nr:hypothetical protein [Actinomycetota bacterium]
MNGVGDLFVSTFEHGKIQNNKAGEMQATVEGKVVPSELWRHDR